MGKIVAENSLFDTKVCGCKDLHIAIDWVCSTEREDTLDDHRQSGSGLDSTQPCNAQLKDNLPALEARGERCPELAFPSCLFV